MKKINFELTIMEKRFSGATYTAPVKISRESSFTEMKEQIAGIAQQQLKLEGEFQVVLKSLKGWNYEFTNVRKGLDTDMKIMDFVRNIGDEKGEELTSGKFSKIKSILLDSNLRYSSPMHLYAMFEPKE